MNIYEGKENYIFISYAHQNKDRVVPILNAFDRNGSKFWYDAGITAGSEWPAFISERLDLCHKLLVFVTADSVKSKNCRDEINHALSLKKEVLVVYLDDVDLNYGLSLLLSQMPSVHRKDFSSDEEFVNAILKTQVLQSCTKDIVDPNISQKSTPSSLYEGDEDYVFVSYAFSDGDKVLPVIKNLAGYGYRLWYDKGIDTGYEWLDLVAKRLKCSAGIIVFLSKKTIESRTVMNELIYAVQNKKNIVVVYLEKFDLNEELQFLLSSFQGLHYYQYSSPAIFALHLKTSEMFQSCCFEKVEKNVSHSSCKPIENVSHGEYHQIFISYRRKGGDVVAKLICSELKNRGYSVFYDYDSLKGGYFDNHITDAIKNCKDFVLVLPRHALVRCRNKNDWVRQEIMCALEEKKNIIPIMVDGYEFPKRLPPEISDVARCNGVRFDMAYLDAVIDKIIEKFDNKIKLTKKV